MSLTPKLPPGALAGLPLDLHDAAPRRARLLVVDDQPINIQTIYQTFDGAEL